MCLQNPKTFSVHSVLQSFLKPSVQFLDGNRFTPITLLLFLYIFFFYFDEAAILQCVQILVINLGLHENKEIDNDPLRTGLPEWSPKQTHLNDPHYFPPLPITV